MPDDYINIPAISSKHPEPVGVDMLPHELIEDLEARVMKRLLEMQKDINNVSNVNVELLLTDMWHIAQEMISLRYKLEFIGTYEQRLDVESIYKKQGIVTAYNKLMDIHADTGRLAKEGRANCNNLANLMSRLQEKIKRGEDIREA